MIPTNTTAYMCVCGGSWDEHRTCFMIVRNVQNMIDNGYPNVAAWQRDNPSDYCRHLGVKDGVDVPWYARCQCHEFRPIT